MVEPSVRATRYTVQAELPPGLPTRNHWTVYVDHWDGDLYYVTDGYQPIGYYSWSAARTKYPRAYRPANRNTDWFRKTYLMDLDTAVALAKRIVPKLSINNMTAEEYVAWVAQRRAERGDS